MPEYSNACVYKIKHNADFNDDNIYIGSTCNLIRRRCKHKNNCIDENKIEYNRYVYKYIRENGGWENFIVIKIKDFSCNSKEELRIEERRMVDLLKPKLNMIMPYVTKEEASIRDSLSTKKFRENNKELIKVKKCLEYENNKEHIKERSKKNYYKKKDDEDFKQKRKEYSEANKEKIRENRMQIVTCECGCKITKQHLTRHMKTDKHKKNLIK